MPWAEDSMLLLPQVWHTSIPVSWVPLVENESGAMVLAWPATDAALGNEASYSGDVAQPWKFVISKSLICLSEDPDMIIGGLKSIDAILCSVGVS